MVTVFYKCYAANVPKMKTQSLVEVFKSIYFIFSTHLRKATV